MAEFSRENKVISFSLAVYIIFLLNNLLYLKSIVIFSTFDSIFFGIYGITFLTWLIIRTYLAIRYRDFTKFPIQHIQDSQLPRVTAIIPCYNEGAQILSTLENIINSDYPRNKISIIVVNDGSTDDTNSYLTNFAKQLPSVQIINFSENKGKRAAMAAGFNRIRHDGLVLFVDSDTVIDRSAIKNSITHFKRDSEVAVVTGHGWVANNSFSIIAAMQEIKYYFAFRFIKAAESHTNSVVCASGCFAIYRVSVIRSCLNEWLNQTFLNKRATYGDDRSLTTSVLIRGYKSIYEANSYAFTIVPISFKKYWYQQLRWKKSWFRETLRLSKFIHKRGALVAFNTYASILMTLIGPIAMLYFLLFPLIISNVIPIYLIAMFNLNILFAAIFGFLLSRNDWWKGGVALFLINPIFVLQTYYALFQLHDTSWGTREKIFESSQITNRFNSLKKRLFGAISSNFLSKLQFARFLSNFIAMTLTSLPLIIYRRYM